MQEEPLYVEATPLRELSPALQKQFSDLSRDILRTFFGDEAQDDTILRSQLRRDREDRVKDLNIWRSLANRVEEEVTAHPILASTSTEGDTVSTSLLHCFLLGCYNDPSVLAIVAPVIKCLIDINPWALWYMTRSWSASYTHITLMARHAVLCKLILWIAEKHTWIFEREAPTSYENYLPFYYLVCNERIDFSDLHRFIELCPGVLEQKYMLPYLIRLGVSFDRFKWVVEQKPKALTYQPFSFSEETFLHWLCDRYRRTNTPSANEEVIGYVVDKCPELLSRKDEYGAYPIQTLLQYPSRELPPSTSRRLRLTRKFLEKFPESYHAEEVHNTYGIFPSPKSFEF